MMQLMEVIDYEYNKENENKRKLIKIKIPFSLIEKICSNKKTSISVKSNISQLVFVEIEPHPTMIVTKKNIYFSDTPYEDIGRKNEDSKWIYSSEQLPPENEVVIVQLDISRVSLLELEEAEEQAIINDKSHVYSGAIVDGFWHFDRYCRFEKKIFNYSQTEDSEFTPRIFNQLMLKWQHLPEEEGEGEIDNRFEIIDL